MRGRRARNPAIRLLFHRKCACADRLIKAAYTKILAKGLLRAVDPESALLLLPLIMMKCLSFIQSI